MLKTLKRFFPGQRLRGAKKLKPQTRGWNDLPPELQEHILSRLSLVELAAASSTGTTFLKAFRRTVAEQQKALHDLAIERFGHEQTKAYTEFLNGCLAEEIEEKDAPGRLTPPFVRTHPINDQPSLSPGLGPVGNGHAVFAVVKARRDTRWVRKNGRIRRENRISIVNLDLGHKELGWILMLQALLSESVFSSLRDGVTACISTLRPASLLTRAWVNAHAAPLMPLLEKCTLQCGEQKIVVKQRVHVGQDGSVAIKGLGLFLR